METKNTTFQGIINGVKQFLIPVFQLDYKWGEGNWQQLWDDISGAGAEGHFVGPIVHVQGSTLSSAPTYLVIDDWKFIPNSSLRHPYGVIVDLEQTSRIPFVLSMVRQAHDQATVERKGKHIEAVV